MYIYVTLVELHTIAGRLMKLFSGIPYSHVTFSFDESLEDCHAIQARNIGTPLVAGYVNENKSYWIKNEKNIRYVKYKIPVTQEEVEKIKKYIDEYSNDTENLYNMYSAVTYIFAHGIKIYKTMLCGEFVAEILNNTSSVKLTKPAHKIFPKDLYELLKEFKEHEGILLASEMKKNRDKSNPYFNKVKTSSHWKKGLYILKENTYRLIFKKVSKKYDCLKTRLNENDYKTVRLVD